MMPHLRYIEFYAGIGGWRMALQKAVDSMNKSATIVATIDRTDSTTTLECCAAFDHSDLCTTVYQHNFATPTSSSCDMPSSVENTFSIQQNKSSIQHPMRIENLTVNNVTQYNADIWMMSPPCQPHTRQHQNQQNDINDKRSNSFLQLCQLLDDMGETAKQQQQQSDPSVAATSGGQLVLLPSIILLENVIGFESSNSCSKWIQTLIKCNYRIAQFHLQPTQVGVPNDRPRYYCVAVRNVQDNTSGGSGGDDDGGSSAWMSRYFSTLDVRAKEESNLVIHTSLEELEVLPEDKIEYDSLPMLTTYLDSTIDQDSSDDVLRVAEALLLRPAAWCFDIVVPSSRRSSCFTSAYGKYAKGTGSVLLQTKNGTSTSNEKESFIITHIDKKFKVEERQYDPNWVSDLLDDGSYLRYLSGTELKRLFGFTDAFAFPKSITMKQQWKLVGNSLNVKLASKMVELAMRATRRTPSKIANVDGQLL